MIPVHPLAELFPAMTGAAFAALKADIAANGLREPITTWRGAIIDGRNRYQALVELGFSAGDWGKSYLVEARDNLSHDDLLPFVISRNLNRRHLDESQRAMVAAKIANMGQGRRAAQAVGKPANLPDSGEDVGARVKSGDEHDETGDAAPVAVAAPVSQAEAAALLNVSERSVRSARRILFTAPAELIGEVERGEAAVSAVQERLQAAYAEVETAPVAQDVVPDTDAIYAAYRRIEATEKARKLKAKQEARAAKERALAGKIAAGNAALGDMATSGKRYGVILADPEWRMSVWSEETGRNRSAENHYPTSTTEAICARPVAAIAADDAVLFLWATVPMLPDALRVMAAWGFVYRSHVVWLKDDVGMGYWFRNQHELLLVGTRGNVVAPAPGTQFRSALAYKAGAHSEKPPFAHEIIETYFPTLPKIEMNARAARDGWDLWGAEAPAVEAAPVPSAVPRVDPDGAVVAGAPDEELRMPRVKGKGITNACIEIHRHDDGRWMWSTSCSTSQGGHGYKVGPKWGKFAASRDEALQKAGAELRDLVQRHRKTPSPSMAAVISWAGRVAGDVSRDITLPEEA